jgi:hypothetical protein
MLKNIRNEYTFEQYYNIEMTTVLLTRLDQNHHYLDLEFVVLAESANLLNPQKVFSIKTNFPQIPIPVILENLFQIKMLIRYFQVFNNEFDENEKKNV